MSMRKQSFPYEGIFQTGYYITLLGTAAILLWIGIFKFTPTEAAAIKPLVAHHPLFGRAYNLFDLQTVSNAIGLVEISTAFLLLLSIKFHFLRRYAGAGIILTFLVTLSFLFFTPGMWKIKDGVVVTDFFILKDIAFLGFGMMLFGFRRKDRKQ